MAELLERCEQTWLLVRECAHCRGLTDPTEKSTGRRQAGDPGPWFDARYDGSCSGCGAEFVEGDSIRADGSGGYESECCGEDDE